jgi:hypothetical protein
MAKSPQPIEEAEKIMSDLKERLTTEIELIEAGMNLDDGQTIEVLREAIARIEALEAGVQRLHDEMVTARAEISIDDWIEQAAALLHPGSTDGGEG